ncbi:hypothetical protein Tco_0281450 [Tanacetum coccineum]
MASHDARLSKFEVDFKQQQSEVTNKIETFLKVINDWMTGALPSDTVKNLKLNVHFTSSVLSARYYSQMQDPQSSSNPFQSVNATKTCFKSTNIFPKDQQQTKTLTVDEIETPKLKEPGKALEDEFKDLHLNLPVLEVLSHAPMYKSILDKYVESLELGKNGSAYVQSEIPKKIKDPGLFILPCRLKLLEDFYVLDMEKDPVCPLLVGRGFLATASAIIDCKKSKIAIGEGHTRSVFGVKEIDHGKEDAELNPFKDVLVFRKMVKFLGAIPINLKGNKWETEDMFDDDWCWEKSPKEGDGAWHIKIELIDPDGEKFDRVFRSMPTTRKLSEKDKPSHILDLDHFHDS